MLHISHRSIVRLKQEMKQLKIEEANAIRTRRTSSTSSSSANISIVPSVPKNILLADVKLNSIKWNRIQPDLISDQLLNEQVYLTLSNMLSTLLSQDPNFAIQSKTTLHRQMKLIGFKYKQTTKSKVFLDSASFQAQCAYYIFSEIE